MRVVLLGARNAKLAVHVTSSCGAQAPPDIDEDARAAHKVEPAPIRPARAVRRCGGVEAVRCLASVARPASVLALSEELAVRVLKLVVAVHDAARTHAQHRRPSIVGSEICSGEQRHQHGHTLAVASIVESTEWAHATPKKSKFSIYCNTMQGRRRTHWDVFQRLMFAERL